MTYRTVSLTMTVSDFIRHIRYRKPFSGQYLCK